MLHAADRLYDSTMQSTQARGNQPMTLAIASRFERVAKLYAKATLGEMARRAWNSAAVAYVSRGDEDNAKRCVGHAERIPSYQAL